MTKHSRINPDHVLKTPADCGCSNDHCPICEGGLGVCKICGKAEAELDEPCELFNQPI